MSLFHSIILGALQGLGEFLPVSSSGHLIVVPWLLGWEEHGLAFDVALHAGTLLAVLTAFAADWWRILASTGHGLARGRPFSEPEGRLLGLLALATLPGAIIGKLFEKQVETALRNPGLVALAMAVMGAVLLVADRRAATGDKTAIGISLNAALLIGCAQALAIVPGVSRSGATITMALFLGLRREEAARFSFLLATPITLGAVLLKVPHLFKEGIDVSVVAGMVTAALVGFVSIKLLLALVQRHSYRPFGYYRLGFGAVVGALAILR